MLYGFNDKRHPKNPTAYCGISQTGVFILSTENEWWTEHIAHPASKEQCDLLFQKMKEAGYEWDAENKMVYNWDTEKGTLYVQYRARDFEQETTEPPKEEDMTEEGLEVAVDVLQKTLGKVFGYESDDGIMKHKNAINAIKKLLKK